MLVHNALTPYVIKPFQDMTWEELGGKLGDEMRAAFAVTKAVLPAMTERGWGRIIYLSTDLSHRPREGMIALGTAKAALAQFARYLAQELSTRGITVNVVEPGTGGGHPHGGGCVRRGAPAAAGGRYPLGRLAHPGDVAQAVAFYASEDNAFMTGTTAAVNGGMSCSGSHTIVRPPGDYGMDLRWLHDGKIDAALAGSTVAPEAIAAEHGRQVLAWAGRCFQIPTVGVAVDRTYIHPDDPAVQAVVRAHRRALQAIHNEPATTVRHIQPFLGRHVAAELGVPATLTAAEFYRTATTTP